MELIEVDKLRDDILNDSNYDNDTINHFLYLVDSQPTVDAEPVPYGGYVLPNKIQICPDCGAKMEEESENE